MSKAAELNQDGHEGATNGSLDKRFGDAETAELKCNEEESDDYEEIEDEEERPLEGDEEGDEDEGEEVQKGQNTLTHLLLGKTNGATTENEVEYEEDEEDVDEGDDDDDDDEYVEDEDEDYAAPPVPLTKKRSIDEVADEEASQGSKKIKA